MKKFTKFFITVYLMIVLIGVNQLYSSEYENFESESEWDGSGIIDLSSGTVSNKEITGLDPITKETIGIITIEVKGYDDGIKSTISIDREEALLDAKRQAIQQAGVLVKSKSELKNSVLTKEYIESKSKAFILPNSRIIHEGYEENGSYLVVLKCKVKKLWQSHNLVGYDKNGKNAEFEIRYLVQEYRWKYASTKIVEFNESQEDILPFFLSPYNQELLKISKDIICVGTASMEGNLRNEELRAEKRSERLLIWIKQVLPPSSRKIGLYTLNVGQFKRSNKNLDINDTAPQRRVIVISVLKKDKKVNLSQALKSAISSNKQMHRIFNVNNYSKFDLISRY